MNDYYETLQREFKRYQQRVDLGTEPTEVQAAIDLAGNELDLLCESQTTMQAEVNQPVDEITRYLAKGL